MGVRYLYLVRHGQYRMNQEDPRYGSLTPLGRRQAKRLGKRLGEVPFDACFSSDVTRAVETLDIIAPFLANQTRRSASTLLREGLPTLASHWTFRVDRADVRKARERMEAAYGRFFKPARGRDRHDLIVGHGNCIRYLVRRALQDQPSKWWRLQILQCSLTIVCVDANDKPPLLISFGDAGHLPLAMQTFV